MIKIYEGPLGGKKTLPWMDNSRWKEVQFCLTVSVVFQGIEIGFWGEVSINLSGVLFQLGSCERYKDIILPELRTT